MTPRNKPRFTRWILGIVLILIVGSQFSGIFVSSRANGEIESHILRTADVMRPIDDHIDSILPLNEESEEIPKIPTPSESDSAPMAANGPNVMNYTMDSIAFEWYAANQWENNILLIGDDVFQKISLPFTFPFYSSLFSEIYVSSNGWLSFTNPTPADFYNPEFPSDDERFTYVIAPYWDDLFAQNNVFVWSTPDFIVIQFENYYDVETHEVGDFEVILFSSGKIVFQYSSIHYDAGATVGLNYGLNSSIYSAYTQGLQNAYHLALEFQYYSTEDISVSVSAPHNLTIGDIYNVTASVSNIGGINASNIDFSFYLDGMLLDSVFISTLSVWETRLLTFEWTVPSYGIFNFSAYATPVVNETYLLNNNYTRIVSILHDLDVKLTLPSYALVNSTYLVEASVSNIGNNEEVNITFDFYLGEILLNTTFIPLLIPAEFLTLNFTWTPDMYAHYIFSANATLALIDPYTGMYEDFQTLVVADNQISPTLGDIFQLSRRDGPRGQPYFLSLEVNAYPSPDQCEFSLSFWDNEELSDDEFTVNPFTRQIMYQEVWSGELFPYWINTENVTVGSFIDFMWVGDQAGEVIRFTTIDYYGQPLTYVEILIDELMYADFELNSGILVGLREVEEYEYSETYDLVFTNVESAVENFHNVRGVICLPDNNLALPLENVSIFVQNTGTYPETTTLTLSYNGNIVDVEVVSLLPGEAEFFSYMDVDVYNEKFSGLILEVEPVEGETFLVDNYDATPPVSKPQLVVSVYAMNTGIEIVGANVSLVDLTTEVEVYTGSTGVNGSLLPIELEDRFYSIAVNYPGYELYTATFNVRIGEIKYVDIYLAVDAFIPGYPFPMLLGFLWIAIIGKGHLLKKHEKNGCHSA